MLTRSLKRIFNPIRYTGTKYLYAVSYIYLGISVRLPNYKHIYPETSNKNVGKQMIQKNRMTFQIIQSLLRQKKATFAGRRDGVCSFFFIGSMNLGMWTFFGKKRVFPVQKCALGFFPSKDMLTPPPSKVAIFTRKMPTLLNRMKN